MSVFKTVVFCILIFLGIACGVYLGAVLAQNRAQKLIRDTHPPNSHVPPEMHLNFKIGDLFPLENFVWSDSTSGNFEGLLMGKKTRLIFVSPGCGPCEDFLEIYKDYHVVKSLDVQTILVIATRDAIDDSQYKPYAKGMQTIFIDLELFHNKYNLNVFPTFLIIDSFGFVKEIYYAPGEGALERIFEVAGS